MEKAFIDRVDDLCYSMRDNDFKKANEIKDELLSYNTKDTSNEDLLTAFMVLISYGIKNDRSTCLESGMAVAFFSIDNLVNRRRDISAAKTLISFAKDTLFLFYMEKKKLYYACVKAFYEQVFEKYPKLSQKGYKDIRNILDNRYDSGFMEIDYAYITYLSAKRGKDLMQKANELGLEYKLICDLVAKYEEFTSFADLGYGFEYYNRPKAIKLFDECKQAPEGYSENNECELLRAPIWLALSYATAEACGAYYGRQGVAEVLKLGDVCPGPTTKEQGIMEREEKARKKKLITRIVILVVLVLAIIFIKVKAGPIIVLLAFGLFVLMESRAKGGKGSSLWYLGHHYVGPAYWLKK
ncbi:MAG: hypothetical protein E7305_07435 [Butyrivibrio sp.]|nr:hypothetical protein [Butyrivibrio sp.]